MAIKFNHVTNTISFTSGACSASFVDSSATGIFETTGYARNCYVTTGETGSFEYVKCPSSPSAGCVICYDGANWVAGTSAGGGGGGTTLPNGTSENSALCWDGAAWVAAQTYVATGQTGNFSAHDFDFNNFNIVYKCNSNLVTSSTGSAILEGSGNCVGSSLYSQINNGCRNFISGGCHGYIENGFCNCISGGNNIYSSILNGCCNRIVNGSCNVGILNGFCNCVSSGIVGVIVGACCSIICNGQAVSIVGGVANQNCFSSRSAIVAGFNNFTCASSTDAAMIGGNSNGMVGAVQGTVIGGVNNRICHASTFLQTGNVIINGFLSRIGGCFNTNYNTIINSYSGCICSGSCNTLINGTNSCLVTGASNSLIIGPRNIICGYNAAVVIGSGITANANNTLFANNISVLGNLDFRSVTESIIVCSTGSSGLIDFDILSGSSIYNICESTAQSRLNLRGNASCTFNSLVPINKTLTVSFLNTNGVIPYELTGVSIDGTSQTVRWMNGTGGFPSGNSSVIDMYSIVTVKTGNNLYNVFGSASFLK